MGYKHSPANAKMNAFMQKMNNTEKSPAKQVDDEKAISQRDKDYDKKKKAAELTFTTRMKESGLSLDEYKKTKEGAHLAKDVQAVESQRQGYGG